MAARLFAAAGRHGIPVYEVRPGIIASDMTAGVEATTHGSPKASSPSAAGASPDDVGRVVAALLRGDAPYSTGSIINVDGGMSIRGCDRRMRTLRAAAGKRRAGEPATRRARRVSGVPPSPGYGGQAEGEASDQIGRTARWRPPLSAGYC
jgi:hypothetical protein